MISNITAAVLVALSALGLAFAGWAIWLEIRNDPPYTQWWDDDEEDNDAYN